MGANSKRAAALPEQSRPLTRYVRKEQAGSTFESDLFLDRDLLFLLYFLSVPTARLVSSRLLTSPLHLSLPPHGRLDR
jgi:hypothetical protein